MKVTSGMVFVSKEIQDECKNVHIGIWGYALVKELELTNYGNWCNKRS